MHILTYVKYESLLKWDDPPSSGSRHELSATACSKALLVDCQPSGHTMVHLLYGIYQYMVIIWW